MSESLDNQQPTNTNSVSADHVRAALHISHERLTQSLGESAQRKAALLNASDESTQAFRQKFNGALDEGEPLNNEAYDQGLHAAKDATLELLKKNLAESKRDMVRQETIRRAIEILPLMAPKETAALERALRSGDYKMTNTVVDGLYTETYKNPDFEFSIKTFAPPFSGVRPYEKQSELQMTYLKNKERQISHLFSHPGAMIEFKAKLEDLDTQIVELCNMVDWNHFKNGEGFKEVPLNAERLAVEIATKLGVMPQAVQRFETAAASGSCSLMFELIWLIKQGMKESGKLIVAFENGFDPKQDLYLSNPGGEIHTTDSGIIKVENLDYTHFAHPGSLSNRGLGAILKPKNFTSIQYNRDVGFISQWRREVEQNLVKKI